MSLFPGIYDHPLQRNSIEKLMFKKNTVFGHFGQNRLFLVVEYGQKCQKAHLHAKTFHMSVYPSQVSTTIRYKDTAWKRIDDGRTDGHPESIGPQPLGLGPY